MVFSNLKPLIPFPALLIEDGSDRTLVITDLHIGWEITYAQKGIHIPSQGFRIQTKLLNVIEECKPKRVIFLGDIKQAIPKITYEEMRSVPKIFESIQKVVSEVSVVMGNHDGNLKFLIPSSVKIFPSEGLVIGREESIGLFHGNAWPSPKVLGCKVLVMGHIHPILLFKDRSGMWILRQVWVKARCDSGRLAQAYIKYLKVKTTDKPEKVLKEKFAIELNEPKLVILPAFNDLVGGASITKFDRRVIGPLLRSGSVMINDSELYLLDGTYIGIVKQVKTQMDT